MPWALCFGCGVRVSAAAAPLAWSSGALWVWERGETPGAVEPAGPGVIQDAVQDATPDEAEAAEPDASQDELPGAAEAAERAGSQDVPGAGESGASQDELPDEAEAGPAESDASRDAAAFRDGFPDAPEAAEPGGWGCR